MALRRVAVIFAVAASVAGLSSAVTTTAAAFPTRSQVGTISDMLVDAQRGVLYVAGSDGVDYGTGLTSRKLVPGVTDIRSLAQAPNGVVYASGADEVYAVDPQTHTATAVSTGDYRCLGDVAATTDRVWVVSACDSTGNTDPRVVSVSIPDGTVTPDAIPIAKPGPIALASTPAAPQLLVVSDHVDRTIGQTMIVAPRWHAYDTVKGNLAEKSAGDFGYAGVRPQLELSPDGSRLLAMSGSGSEFETATGRFLDDVPALGPVDAAAFTRDRHLALSQFGLLDVYGADRARALRSQQYRDTPTALAWLKDSLVVATHDGANNSIDIVPHAYRTPLRIVFTDDLYVRYWGQRVTQSGILVNDFTVAAGVRMSVTRSGPGGSKVLPTVVSNALGRFTFTDVLPRAGEYRYTLRRVADADYAALSAVVVRDIAARAAGLRITTDRRTYFAGQRGVITASLAHWSTNRTVTIYANARGKRTVVLARGPVDRRGRLSVHVNFPWTAVLTARYGGDARYARKEVAVGRGVRARIVTALSKPVRKSHGYFVYPAGQREVFAVGVVPAERGYLVGFLMQRFRHGAWHNFRAGDGAENRRGTAGVFFTGTSGVRYRLRAHVSDTGLWLGKVSVWRYVTFR